MESSLFPIDEVSDERSNKINLKPLKLHEIRKDDSSSVPHSNSSIKGGLQKMMKRDSQHWQYYSGTFTSSSALKSRHETSKTLSINNKSEVKGSDFFNKFKTRFWSKNKAQQDPDSNYKLATARNNNNEAKKRPHCYVLFQGNDHIPLNSESSCSYFKLYVKNYTLPSPNIFNKSRNNSDNTLIYFGDDVKIVKLFSSNYKRGEFLHICPDFGWRVLISNNLLTKSIKSSDPLKVLTVSFYKESRRVQFSTCLTTLAINLTIRAARVGAKYGLIKLTPLINKMFPDIDDSDTFAGMEPSIVYSGSTKLGLFTPQISLNSAISNEFYSAFGIPDYGWRLNKKSVLSTYLQNGCSSRISKSTRYPDALFYHMQLCDGFITISDVPSYGMNMTELLYRLEGWDSMREKFPQNMYNFEIVQRDYKECTIKDVNGTLYTIIPEEVILNVSTFLQSYFITQSTILS